MLGRKLRWALAVTVALTALALSSPDGSELGRSGHAGFEGRPTARRPAVSVPGHPAPLPVHLDQQGFSPPERDLFAARAPAPAPVQPIAPAAVAPLPLQLAPAPAPAVAARYVAQFLTPTGERLLYLRDGEQLVAARIGAALSGGYVIDALVRADTPGPHASAPTGAANAAEAGHIVAVEVVHPASGQRHVVSIPALH